MDDHNEEIDAKENRRELATETTSDQGIVISSVTSIANKVGQEKKSLQMGPPKKSQHKAARGSFSFNDAFSNASSHFHPRR